MTYDAAEWHRESVIEHDLRPTAASTHIAMFMAWLALHELTRPKFARAELLARIISPGQYLRHFCRDQFDESMLTDTGNAFTKAVYEQYRAEYAKLPVAAQSDSFYGAPDNWDTYEEVATLVNHLFRAWQNRSG
ncbi:hypothetical protein [Mycolicibacterium goodii]|uniref:DUF7832 domain-containing protein n=1 Tax=Mycolicibacterium goodii TaxID=134601 RepID=A0A0K0X4L2_MYCGD|nr:hypothetical protein AFA91_11100 [Mycolicibacterium goodii]